MSDLRFIIDPNEDDYPPPPHRSSTEIKGSLSPASLDTQRADSSSSRHGTSTLVYRGSNSKPEKSSKSGGGSSTSSARPYSSSTKRGHHHNQSSKSGSKGKGKEGHDADAEDVDNYEDYDQSSANYTMDPSSGYATSGGHYYHHSHHAHSGAPAFEPLQGAAIMHSPGIAVNGAYGTGAVSHYTGAMPGVGGSASMQPQTDMSGHYAGDAAGYTGYHDDTEYTPVTHRPSRAKKGKRVHYCDVCKKTYTRAEHLRRHQLAHSAPLHYCQFPDCGRAFHRADLLARHQTKKHIEGDQSHDGDDGDSGYSDNQGPPPSGDYPAEAWATTAAVRSPLLFSLAGQRPGSREDNNHVSSINVDEFEDPTSQHGQKHRPSLGKKAIRSSHSEIRSSNTQTEKGKRKRATRASGKGQNNGVSAIQHPRASHNADDIQNLASSDKKNSKVTKANSKGHEGGRGRSSRVLDQTKTSPRRTALGSTSLHSPGVHGFLISSIGHESGSAGSGYFHEPLDTAQHHAGAHSRHARRMTLPTSSHEAFSLQGPARNRHQYHNSDPSPAAGWLLSDSAGHIAENFACYAPSGHSQVQRIGTGSASGTVVGMGLPLQATYATLPGGGTRLDDNSNSKVQHHFLPSANDFEVDPSYCMYGSSHSVPAVSTLSASQPRVFGSASIPLPPLTTSNFSANYLSSAGDVLGNCHIDSDSNSGSWTASSSLPSSVASSQGHACTTIDDMGSLRSRLG